MSRAGQNPEEFSEIIRQLEARFRTGEADRSFASYESEVRENVAKLQEAEQLDPETLKLTVTL